MPPSDPSPNLEIATFTPFSALLALKSGAQRIELCSSKNKDGLTPGVEDFLTVISAVRGFDNSDLEREGRGIVDNDGIVSERGERNEDMGEDRNNRDEIEKENKTELKNLLAEKINIMIRPHDNSLSGPGPNQNFRVGNEVFEKMKEEIRIFRGLGGRGFVFGILKDGDGEGRTGDERGKRGLIVDKERCAELIRMAREGKDGEKVRCTFHRAFDRIDEERMGEQLEILKTLSFTSLLTSGGARTSTQGISQLAKLVQQAVGRIDIIVGGGVRSGNLRELMLGTGATWFHSSAVFGEGEEVNAKEVRRLREVLGGGDCGDEEGGKS